MFSWKSMERAHNRAVLWLQFPHYIEPHRVRTYREAMELMASYEGRRLDMVGAGVQEAARWIVLNIHNIEQIMKRK